MDIALHVSRTVLSRGGYVANLCGSDGVRRTGRARIVFVVLNANGTGKCPPIITCYSDLGGTTNSTRASTSDFAHDAFAVLIDTTLDVSPTDIEAHVHQQDTIVVVCIWAEVVDGHVPEDLHRGSKIESSKLAALNDGSVEAVVAGSQNAACHVLQAEVDGGGLETDGRVDLWSHQLPFGNHTSNPGLVVQTAFSETIRISHSRGSWMHS